jgi:hypothetical protein
VNFPGEALINVTFYLLKAKLVTSQGNQSTVLLKYYFRGAAKFLSFTNEAGIGFRGDFNEGYAAPVCCH